MPLEPLEEEAAEEERGGGGLLTAVPVDGRPAEAPRLGGLGCGCRLPERCCVTR